MVLSMRLIIDNYMYKAIVFLDVSVILIINITCGYFGNQCFGF